jgi:hypothetical protein
MGRRRLLLPSLALLGVALAGSAHDAAALITRGALDIPLAEKVAVVGDRAYVVTQGLFPVLAARLVVVDVADPEAPRILGELDLGFPEAQDLAVAGGYAYVAAGFEGFYVFDVSDPSAPRQVAALEETPAGAVWVEGTRAYLAGAFAGGPRGQTIVTGLHVLDVTDPAAPVEIGDLPNAGGSDIAVSDGFAYVSQRFSLLLVDVRDPTLPVALEEIPTSGASIELAGGLAYVSGLGLQVLDLSDPAAPVEIGRPVPSPETWPTWWMTPASGRSTSRIPRRPPRLAQSASTPRRSPSPAASPTPSA